METSKKILIVDYVIMVLLIVCTIIFYNLVDLIPIDTVWAGQVAISTGFYYWKARSENRIKVPIKVLETLPEDMKKNINPTEIILEIIRQSQ